MNNDTTIWRDLPHGSDLQPGDRCVDITKERTTNTFTTQTPNGEPLEKHRWQRPVPSHPTPQPGIGQPYTEQLERDYQKIVNEVLKCNPAPASQRNDDTLEPPWEVIARIRRENTELRNVIAYAAQVAREAIKNS